MPGLDGQTPGLLLYIPPDTGTLHNQLPRINEVPLFLVTIFKLKKAICDFAIFMLSTLH